MKHSRQRGFTLIELLVVVSIIGLLSSIVLTSLSKTKSKAIDASKTQEVRQFELAIQLYMADHGGIPPLLNNNCASSVILSGSDISTCVAKSSGSGNSAAAWDVLKTELNPYLKTFPSDTCTDHCPAYVYVAPAAMRYFAGIIYYGDDSIGQIRDAYQMYSNLENSPQVGTKTFGSFFDPDKKYLRIESYVNGTLVYQAPNCGVTVINPPPHGQGAQACVFSSQVDYNGTYQVQWLSGYPAGASHFVSINPSQITITSAGVYTFRLDFN